MSERCRNRYDRDNIVFQAGLKTGVFGKVGSLLDGLPVWYVGETGECRLDVILYGFYLGGEWSPPQGVIRDATRTPTLIWLPKRERVGSPSAWSHNGEPSEWRRFHHLDDARWDARERIIACCERVGELLRLQRSGKPLSDEDVVFLHQISLDYRRLLPTELFEQCRRLYPSFFDWLAEWERHAS